MPTGLHQHIPSVLWSQAAVATLLDSALPPKGHGDHSEGLQLRLPEAKQVLEATAQRTQRMDGGGKSRCGSYTQGRMALPGFYRKRVEGGGPFQTHPVAPLWPVSQVRRERGRNAEP